MGGDDYELRAAALRRKKFIKDWFKNPQGITTYACLAAGFLCVVGIAHYHFVQSNYIHFDKRKQTEMFHRGYGHILSDNILAWLRDNYLLGYKPPPPKVKEYSDDRRPAKRRQEDDDDAPKAPKKVTPKW